MLELGRQLELSLELGPEPASLELGLEPASLELGRQLELGSEPWLQLLEQLLSWCC